MTGESSRPLLVLEVQVGERTARVDVLGIERDHRGVQLLRLVVLAELVQVDVRGLEQQANLVDRDRRVALGAHHHLGGLEPVTAIRVLLGQRLHRRHVAGIEGETAEQVRLRAPRRRRAGCTGSCPCASTARPGGARRRQLNEVRHHVDRAVPLADLLVQAAEGIERALLRRHRTTGRRCRPRSRDRLPSSSAS